MKNLTYLLIVSLLCLTSVSLVSCGDDDKYDDWKFVNGNDITNFRETGEYVYYQAHCDPGTMKYRIYTIENWDKNPSYTGTMLACNFREETTDTAIRLKEYIEAQHSKFYEYNDYVYYAITKDGKLFIFWAV